MNAFCDPSSDFVHQVALNGYFIADRKGAAAIAREAFPAAGITWVYYREVERLAIALQAAPEVSQEEQEAHLVRLEKRLSRLQPPEVGSDKLGAGEDVFTSSRTLLIQERMLLVINGSCVDEQEDPD